jgi:glucose-6-phosphate isomerase, archaeal
MKVDLSDVAGFRLALDLLTHELTASGPVRLDRVTRRQADLAPVLLEPDGLAPTTELYWNFPLLDAGPASDVLEQTGLTFSCVLLPALKIGREYVKTQGHYHPPMPGSDISYPEIYAHLWGEPSLILQRRLGDRADMIDDCVLLELRDGAIVTIPPGYAHILINPSRQPAAIAGLYSRAFSPLYEPIVRMAGAAYYLIDDGGEQAIPNSRYTARPLLRRLGDFAGTPFQPPDGKRPLWSSFLSDPGGYSFLAQPDFARRQFSLGAQQ